MRAYERLLKYVVIHTTSDENSETVPSTKRQFDLANALAEEMKKNGYKDHEIINYVYPEKYFEDFDWRKDDY